jgi:hypothetical protein
MSNLKRKTATSLNDLEISLNNVSSIRDEDDDDVELNENPKSSKRRKVYESGEENEEFVTEMDTIEKVLKNLVEDEQNVSNEIILQVNCFKNLD